MVARQTFSALGTTAVVFVASDDRLEVAVSEVEDVVDAVDRACSRFRLDSEISTVNRMAGTTVAISPLFTLALKLALQGAGQTNGLVDPTIGAAVRLLGYDATFDELPKDGPAVFRVEQTRGWHVVDFDEQAQTVKVPVGVELDLGATAKGLAADLAADQAREAAGCGVLVSLGGDMAISGESPASGWTIGIADDHRAAPEQQDERIVLHKGGIATSGTQVRRWKRGGVQMHHIVDPATGLPARSPWKTVTVIGRTCVEANIAATASIVMGEDAVSWLKGLGFAARLARPDGGAVYVGDWPPNVL